MQVHNPGHRLRGHWSSIAAVSSLAWLQGSPVYSLTATNFMKGETDTDSPRRLWTPPPLPLDKGHETGSEQWKRAEVINLLVVSLLKTSHHGIQPFLPLLWQCKKSQKPPRTQNSLCGIQTQEESPRHNRPCLRMIWTSSFLLLLWSQWDCWVSLLLHHSQQYAD